MPGSEDLKAEVLAFFDTHFGVRREVLAPLVFQEKHAKIWAASALPPEGICSKRPPGLSILRRSPIGLKPTSAFLQLLGDQITASRAEIKEIKELKRLLLGQAIPASYPDGFVALAFHDDVLGCGAVTGGKLRVWIPTARRKALLDALFTETRRSA